MSAAGRLSIAAVNAMSREEFVGEFGEIAEHSPWVAERASGKSPFDGLDALVNAFTDAIRSAGQAAQLALIRAHPDLADKAKQRPGLTADSRREQAGAGLDALSATQYERFADLNHRYRAKFSMPFIFAVKGADAERILAAFEHRIDEPLEAELNTAIDNVCRIIRFRLEDRVG